MDIVSSLQEKTEIVIGDILLSASAIAFVEELTPENYPDFFSNYKNFNPHFVSGVKHLINNEIQCLSINIGEALSEGSDIASIHKIHKSLNNNRDKLKERNPNCETTLYLMLKIHSKLLDEKSH